MVGLSLLFQLLWQLVTFILNLVIGRDPYFTVVEYASLKGSTRDYCTECPTEPQLHWAHRVFGVLRIMGHIFYSAAFFFLGQYFFVLVEKFKIKRFAKMEAIQREVAHDKYRDVADGSAAGRRKERGASCSCSLPNVGCCWSSQSDK